MADTTFTNSEGTIDANWLNDVNDAVYNSNDIVNTKIIEIGNWNMYVSGGGTGSNTNTVLHGLDWTKIRAINVLIRSDAGFALIDINAFNPASVPTTSDSFITATSTSIAIGTAVSGPFDTTDYDNDSDFNRGWVTIQYVN